MKSFPSLRTPVCDLLGCDVPILLAGMGGVARADLVTAVTEAGGFGFLGMVREAPDFIQSEIEKVRARTSRDCRKWAPVRLDKRREGQVR